MQGAGTKPTISDVITTFGRAASLFMGHEATKAQEELRQKAVQAGTDVGLLAAGGIVAYGGFLSLLAAAVLGLRRLGLPDWLAALMVGLLAGGTGTGLALTGVERLRQADAVPHQTIATLKDDVAAVIQ